jgi:hypothetical protein
VNRARGWFLPSREEPALMYRHLKAAGVGGFDDGGLSDNVSSWALSQLTADIAAHIDFADLGRLHHDDKDLPRQGRSDDLTAPVPTRPFFGRAGPALR